MKLRNRLGYLNVLPEARPKRKLSSLFTAVIYFSLLSAIFLYLFFYTLSGFFYVTARGHVELPRYFVQTDRSGKIISFLVSPEEKVVRGQPLFEIRDQSDGKNGHKSGMVTGRTNGSLQTQMLSLEQILRGLASKNKPAAGLDTSGGISGSGDLVKVINDIKYTRSRLSGIESDIGARSAARKHLADTLPKERLHELKKFGKRVIPIQLGVAKKVGKLDHEITRGEGSLRSLRESLAGWKAFRQSLGSHGGDDPGVMVSREIVRINNDIRSRRATLSLIERQLRDKIESYNRLKTSFTEIRVLELGKGKGRGGGAVMALDNEIDDLRYKTDELKNRVESLVNYRKDLVNNEIKSLEYKIREEIRKIVELGRIRLNETRQYKVIATEHKFVSLDENIKELSTQKSRLENKLEALIKRAGSLAENELEKLRYEIYREQNENGQLQDSSNKNGGYFFRPASGYGNFVPSPVEGSIMFLYRREGEYTKRGDVVLSIREKRSEVEIKGFFKTRNMSSLRLEKEVVVEFPDNMKSPGIIKNFYSSLLQNTGKTISPAIEPTEIVADIVPRNPSDSALWERYDQLEVSIKLKK